MEFLAGVFVALFFVFLGYKIHESQKRKKEIRNSYLNGLPRRRSTDKTS